MDSILKSRFIQLKEKLNFNLDINNIKFYQKIKNMFTNTVFISAAAFFSFLLSVWILNGFSTWTAHFFISFIFFPLFFSFIFKLNLKHPLKFTLLSSRLPSFLKLFSFIKSTEDSFFFSKDKISKMLVDENFQLVFYDFFNMVKNHIFNVDEQRHFTKNVILFKSSLECGNFIKAADFFMELYGVAYQFEHLIYNDYQNTHDLQLLKARKSMIDDFLKESELEEYAKNNTNSLNIYKNSFPHTPKTKVNWKKLMDE